MGSCTSIEESDVGIVEQWGKFLKLGNPGCICLPCGARVKDKVSLRTQQIQVKVESNTNDNVFCILDIQVQYKVNPDEVYDAYYSLQNVKSQISSYVLDSVRDKVPTRNLDNLMKNKHELADNIQIELQAEMGKFGYEIVKVLIIDVEPDAQVKKAMNEINAAERNRAAAMAKAEANKILKIKEAEADAEARKLSGEGLAEARKAIVRGLQETVNDFTETFKGLDAETVLKLVLTSQYYDTLKDIGTHSNSNTVFLPPHEYSNPTRDALLLNNTNVNKQ